MSPRYSIIRGDFPEDQRADVAHFRVYTLIGRHTDDAGWCRLKQITIGNEVGLSRKTVNLKIKDLVNWGYVEKREHDGSGRAIWYRTVMDAPVAPPLATATLDDDHCDDGPVTGALHVGCNTEPTCNAIEVTPGVTLRGNTERPLLNEDSPLTPPLGGGSGKLGDDSRDNLSRADISTETHLALLRASGRHREAVDTLVGPLLLSGKRLAFGKGPAMQEALAEIAAAAHGLPRPALDAAVRRLIAQPKKLTVRLVRSEIDTARAGGAMVVVRRGSPQWQRWQEYFTKSDPRQSLTMARFDTWQVAAEWPPSAQSQRGAA